MRNKLLLSAVGTAALTLLLSNQLLAKEPIIHDAEHYILEAQHGEKWSAEDGALDARLAELK